MKRVLSSIAEEMSTSRWLVSGSKVEVRRKLQQLQCRHRHSRGRAGRDSGEWAVRAVRKDDVAARIEPGHLVDEILEVWFQLCFKGELAMKMVVRIGMIGSSMSPGRVF